MKIQKSYTKENSEVDRKERQGEGRERGRGTDKRIDEEIDRQAVRQ